MTKLTILEDSVAQLGGKGSGNWGHAGIPGKQGGSMSRSKAMSIRTGKDWEVAQARAKQSGLGAEVPITDIGTVHSSRINYDGEDDAAIGFLEDTAENTFPEAAKHHLYSHSFEGMSQDKQIQITRETAEMMAKKYNLDPDTMEETIAAWTAGPNNPNSAMIMEAVSEKFGAPMTAHQRTKILENKDAGPMTKWSDVEGRDVDIRPITKQQASSMVDAMYQETQYQMRLYGIDSLRLQRGVALPQGISHQKGDIVPIQLSPMSSWTTSNLIAKEFEGMVDNGIIFTADIPAARILSFPLTGIGSFSEGEFIVIGGVNDEANVYSAGYGT